MIAALIPDRCTGCQRCTVICPAHVFDAAAPGQPPLLARTADCQTCFACELHCETDALYVDPDVFSPMSVDPQWLIDSGMLGVYRRDSGWHEWAEHPDHSNLHWRMEEVFARGRTLNIRPKE